MLKKMCISFVIILCIFTFPYFMGCSKNAQIKLDSPKSQDRIAQSDTVHRNFTQKSDPDWVSRFDFNGDSIKDSVIWSFSNGAHCCYSISVLLKGINKRFDFPFQMDGGYLFGLNLNQPNQFNIKDFDGDGLPEIFMLIENYNGALNKIPKEWMQNYSIFQNRIIIKFDKNNPVVKDFND